jgi:hypothetical protein
MQMKKHMIWISLLLITFVLSSCTMARFHGLPLKRLNQVPQTWTGPYVVKTGMFGTSNRDSFSVEVQLNGWMIHSKGHGQNYDLTNDIRLYDLGKCYLLVMRDETIKELWNYMFVEPLPNQINLYPVMADGRSHPSGVGEFMSQMQLNLNHDGGLPPIITNTPVDDKPVDPQLHDLSGRTAVMYYMMQDESRLVQYFDRKLRGNPTISLVRKSAEKKGKGK